MDVPLSIEEFNALLNSEQEESPLVNALSQLTTIEQPETIVVATTTPTGWWFGWT